MDGMQILNTYQSEPDVLLITTCVIAVVLGGILLAISISERDLPYALFSIFVILIFIGAIITIESNTVQRFEVIVDDSVSFLEFTEKYEIIEQRGNILVIEEKTD